MLSSPISTRYENEIKSRKRTSLFFIVLFLAGTLVLSVVQDSQILPVLLLYACVLLEGISLSAYVWSSRSYPEIESTRLNEEPPEPKGLDVVSNMRVYVSFAVKGSEHSRREIAYTIRNLVEDGKRTDLAQDRAFQADLQRVVWQYIGPFEKDKPTARASRQEREAYVSSLERIIQKLESEQ